MSCSISEATMRLLTLWTHRVVDDSTLPSRLTLRDFLDDDLIRWVANHDHLREFSESERQTKVAALNDETYRRQMLVRGWQQSCEGALQ
jgi:hypothetical protein